MGRRPLIKYRTLSIKEWLIGVNTARRMFTAKEISTPGVITAQNLKTFYYLVAAMVCYDTFGHISTFNMKKVLGSTTAQAAYIVSFLFIMEYIKFLKMSDNKKLYILSDRVVKLLSYTYPSMWSAEYQRLLKHDIQFGTISTNMYSKEFHAKTRRKRK